MLWKRLMRIEVLSVLRVNFVLRSIKAQPAFCSQLLLQGLSFASRPAPCVIALFEKPGEMPRVRATISVATLLGIVHDHVSAAVCCHCAQVFTGLASTCQLTAAASNEGETPALHAQAFMPGLQQRAVLLGTGVQSGRLRCVGAHMVA